MRIEPEFWSVIDKICQDSDISLNDFAMQVRSATPNQLTTAVRVVTLLYSESRLAGHAPGRDALQAALAVFQSKFANEAEEDDGSSNTIS